MVDHEGNAINVNDVIYVPVKVTSLGSGTFSGTTGYTGVTITQIPGPDVHHGKPGTWPALPA